MLTAARLVAGLLFAALAWGTSQMIVPLFPEGTDVGWFAEVNAGLCFVIGWNVAGSRAGGSWAAAISYGVTATVAMVLSCLFLHSFLDMIGKSMRKTYDGPVEAVVAVFGLMVDYGALMATGPVLGTLALGGILAGLVVEWTGRNFR